MKKIIKKIILIFVVLALSACSFSKDDSTTNGTELRERQKLAESYKAVTGAYRGTLTTSSSRQDVELSLFTLEQNTAAGATKLVLIANFKKINPVGNNTTFESRYVPETGELVLSSLLSSFGPDDIHTVNLIARGERLTGEAKSVSGVIGVLDLSLQSRQSTVPGEGERESYKERIRNQYNAIAGTYKGNIVPLPQDGAPFAVIVQINVADMTNEAGEVLPQLMGILSYPATGTRDLDLTLTMVYRPDLTPAQLNITARPRFIGNNEYKATLQGTLKDNKYSGTMTSTAKGFEGNFVLTKQP